MMTTIDSPFEIVETTGENALAKWEELKSAGRGVPVVVGPDVEPILDPFQPTPASEALAAASAINFPEDLPIMRRDENAAALARLREMDPSLEDDDEAHEALRSEGEWPAEVSRSPGLSVVHHFRSGRPLAKVYIVLVPTDDPPPSRHICILAIGTPAPRRNITSLRCGTGATAMVPNWWA